MRTDAYRAALAGRSWLILLETSAYQIPERLAEIDPVLFAVFNVRSQMYEVHEVGPPPGYTKVFSAEVLDARVITRVLDARWDTDPIGRAEAWAVWEQAKVQRRLDDAADGTARNLVDAARFADWGRGAF